MNIIFSLLYDLNASLTKIKEKYNFVYREKKLTLISKEVLKYGQEGVSNSKVYFNKCIVNSESFEDLQSLASGIQDRYSENPVTLLYDNQQKLFGKEIYKMSNEDFYINYPNVKYSEIEILNVELANNLAFYLHNQNADEVSKVILEQVVERFPNRVVAWLNLGDVYWNLGDKLKAKNAYRKYILLMKSQNKELSRIPQRVYDRS